MKGVSYADMFVGIVGLRMSSFVESGCDAHLCGMHAVVQSVDCTCTGNAESMCCSAVSICASSYSPNAAKANAEAMSAYKDYDVYSGGWNVAVAVFRTL